MKMKIAVVQMKIKQFFPEENLKKAENFIKIASSSDVDIIVFPEDFLTSPICGKLEFVDSERKYLSFFQTLAKEYKINIIPGSFIEKEKPGIYNTTYYIDSQGKVKGKYRKINLWHSERKYLSYGNEISVFNTEYGKIGLIICWDLAFPEIFRRMTKKGVNIVFCPSYWTYEDANIGLKYDYESEAKFIDALCIARAFENEIVLVFCNAAGSFEYLKARGKLVGHSQITAPFIGVIKKLNHNREEMFIQTIDIDIIKDAEKVYRIRKDLKSRIL